VLELVERHRSQGRSVGEVWAARGGAIELLPGEEQPGENKAEQQSSYELTGEERGLIEEVKAKHAQYRHRRIREFFEALGAELSFARVRRPTDNALTERFYRTVKQEDLSGGQLSRWDLGTRGDRPLHRELQPDRPRQGLFNFGRPTCISSMTRACCCSNSIIKRQTRERKAYWAEKQKIGPQPIEVGYPDKDHPEIVDPGANTETFFHHQQPDSLNESVSSQQVLPAYLWPFHSHLSSVPNLVGHDTHPHPP